MSLVSSHRTLSPLAQLRSWSQATCNGIKGNFPTLRNLYMQIDTSKTHLSYYETHRTMRIQTGHLGVTKLHRANICRRQKVSSWNVISGINTTDNLFVLGRKRPYDSRLTIRGRRNFILKSCWEVRDQTTKESPPSMQHERQSYRVVNWTWYYKCRVKWMMMGKFIARPCRLYSTLKNIPKRKFWLRNNSIQN